MTWTLLINGVDYTTSYNKAEFIGELNKPSTFELELFDIDSDDSNVRAGNIVKLQLNGNTMFKGKITRVEYRDDGVTKIYGYDMSILLLERTHNQRWTSANTSDIVNAVCSGVINVGTNTNYGTINFAIENEPKLLGLAKLARQINYDWWVSWDSSDNDYFNIHTQKGNSTPQAVFYTSGSNVNCLSIQKEEDREAVINKVKVLGYGDGTQQINSGWVEHSASQSYYGIKEAIFLDRTIKDVTSAQRLANTILNIYKAHDGTNPQPFYRISLRPIETDYTFTTGDVVTINDERTGLSSSDYRVIKKDLVLYSSRSPELKIEIANRKRTFLDKILRDSELTHVISSYQQINDPGHSHSGIYSGGSHSHLPGTYQAVNHSHSVGSYTIPDHSHIAYNLQTAQDGLGSAADYFGMYNQTPLYGDDQWHSVNTAISVGNSPINYHGVWGFFKIPFDAGAGYSFAQATRVRVYNMTTGEYWPSADGILLNDGYTMAGQQTIIMPIYIHLPKEWSAESYVLQYLISNEDYWLGSGEHTPGVQELHYAYFISVGHSHAGDMSTQTASVFMSGSSGGTAPAVTGTSDETAVSASGTSDTSTTNITG